MQDETLYLGLPPGATFPLNIHFGIPLCPFIAMHFLR
jgi:hypothetical protein